MNIARPKSSAPKQSVRAEIVYPQRQSSVSTPPLLVNRREAARLLGLSERGLVKREKAGDFVALKLGTSIRYSVSYLESRIRELAMGSPSVN